jgi:molybdopterin-guanine dinucleotide biosynthesis protein A
MNAYILIGGRSSRMGQAKAEVEFGGATILDRVTAAAADVFSRVLAVQRPGGPVARSVTTIFEGPHDGEAPLWGVRAALLHAKARCFVMAVDYPLLRSDILGYLAREFASAPEPVLAPMWGGRVQTLCAGYSPEILPMLDERIAARRFDLRGIIDAAGGRIIEEPFLRGRFRGEPLLNVNTPEELARARSMLYEPAGAR